MKNILISILISLTFFPVFSQEMLTLEKCKELALKNNMRAKNAELTILAAKEQKKEAFTKYFPSISLSGMGFLAEKPMISMEMDIASMMAPLTGVLQPIIGWAMQSGVPIDMEALQAMQAMQEAGPMKIDALKNGIIAGAVAMQPLFAGGQIVNGNKLAKAGVEVRQLQKQMTDNEVLLTTERYFWQLVALQEKMKTIENSEKMLDHILSDVKVAVEAGLTTRNDFTRVELERNKLAGFRLKAENGLQVLKLAFAQHIGVPAENLNIQQPPFDEFQLPPTTGNETRALQNRPEYKLLQKNVDVSNLLVKMEIGKNLPTVAIGAGYQYMKFDLHTKDGIKNNFAMGFASVSIPITDWWGGAHAIKMKKLEMQAAENMQKANSDLLLVQMQQVRNELNEAYFQIQLAKKSISVAEENLRMSNDNYNAGITTLVDLLEAQNLLQQTQDQFVEAVTEYYKKLAEHRQMISD